MFKGLGAQRLLALFVGGWLLFNFPLLSVWDGGPALFGIPLFPAALFAGWCVLIALVAWVNEKPDGDD